MSGPSRIDQTPVRLSTRIAEDRQTPRTDFGARMKDGMSVAAGAIASGASVAAPLVPGGAIISAAVTGVNTLGGSLSSGQRVGTGTGFHGAYGNTTTTSTTSASGSGVPVVNDSSSSYAQGVDLINQQQAANMQYLVLQNNMQQESQKYMTMSNVIKVRHDTAKNSIGNVR